MSRSVPRQTVSSSVLAVPRVRGIFATTSSSMTRNESAVLPCGPFVNPCVRSKEPSCYVPCARQVPPGFCFPSLMLSSPAFLPRRSRSRSRDRDYGRGRSPSPRGNRGVCVAGRGRRVSSSFFFLLFIRWRGGLPSSVRMQLPQGAWQWLVSACFASFTQLCA